MLGWQVADIFSMPDVLIVLAVIALFFGGSQLPKLARSLGSASHEFKKGVEEGQREDAVQGTAGTAPQGSATAAPQAKAVDNPGSTAS